MFEEVPCAAGFINDVVVVVEDGDREFVAAQIFPDVFDRIEFRSVRWQTHKGDVFGDRERGSNVIAGAIEDESGVLPAATLRAIAVRCSDMVWAFAAGMTRPAATRRCGQAAPNR